MSKHTAPMKILLTNNALHLSGGTELYIRDLALELLRLGHNPIAYSPVLGQLAEELRAATIPVVDDLADLGEAPDIIHGHHHHETLTALFQFPHTPCVQVCHGWVPWEEMPVAHPAIMRHVAVDDLCRERILSTPGIKADDVDVVYNFTDLRRFKPDRALPDTPRRALIFSNYETSIPDAVRTACERAGIAEIDIIGRQSGMEHARPEDVLAGYDIVFAKAKAAIEAIVSGCAVIILHHDGLGGMVTPENLPAMRRLNFGIRTVQGGRPDADSLFAELQCYDPEQARKVTQTMREEAGLDQALSQWIGIYERALARWEQEGRHIPIEARMKAGAAYLRSIAKPVKRARSADLQLEQKQRVIASLRQQLKERNARVNQLGARLKSGAAKAPE